MKSFTGEPMPDNVRAILAAESLRGARTTFVIRLVIGAFGVLSAAAVSSVNKPAATTIAVLAGTGYLIFSALGLVIVRRGIPAGWLKYAGATADASVVTLISITGLYNYSGAYETLLAPIFSVLYVMFNILTGLQYSIGLSLFAGLMAAAQRGLVLGWVLSKHMVHVSEVAVYGDRAITLSDQFTIIVFIAFSGFIAAWVAYNARKLLIKSATDAVRKVELEKRERHFSKYLSGPALEHVLDHPENIQLGGERRTATLLVAAVYDLGALAENKDPEAVVELLNARLSDLTEIVLRYGGTVDRFVGDGLIAMFGLPYEIPDPAGSAVRAAVEMHERIQARSTGTEPLRLGVGIAQGIVVAGNVGSSERMEYTIVGPALSRAQRLQGASLAHGPVLVDESVHEAVRGLYRTRASSVASATGLDIPTYAIEFGPTRSESGSTMLSAG